MDIIIQSDNFTKNDISQLVNIHIQEIHMGFLTSLGKKALSLLFLMTAESDNGILLSVKDPDTDIQTGFLIGTLNTKIFYKDFYKKKLLGAIFILLPKIFSFKIIYKIFEVLIYPSKNEVKKLPAPELLDIAVLKEYQGKGLAKKLFFCFVDHLKKLEVSEFKITTGEGLLRAQRFYESLGAKRVADMEVHKGQKTVVYVYDIKI